MDRITKFWPPIPLKWTLVDILNDTCHVTIGMGGSKFQRIKKWYRTFFWGYDEIEKDFWDYPTFKAIETYGVKPKFMFTVDDLYKKNNIAKVTRCLEEIDKVVREPKLEI